MCIQCRGTLVERESVEKKNALKQNGGMIQQKKIGNGDCINIQWQSLDKVE